MTYVDAPSATRRLSNASEGASSRTNRKVSSAISRSGAPESPPSIPGSEASIARDTVVFVHTIPANPSSVHTETTSSIAPGVKSGAILTSNGIRESISFIPDRIRVNDSLSCSERPSSSRIGYSCSQTAACSRPGRSTTCARARDCRARRSTTSCSPCSTRPPTGMHPRDEPRPPRARDRVRRASIVGRPRDLGAARRPWPQAAGRPGTLAARDLYLPSHAESWWCRRRNRPRRRARRRR